MKRLSAIAVFKYVTKIVKLIEPFQSLGGSIIAIFAGSGILGFLTAHATSAYALSRGFRVPAEGTPYLSAAVSISVFVALSGIGATAAAVYALAVLLRSIARRLVPPSLVRSKGRRNTLTCIASMAVLSLPMTAFGLWSLGIPLSELSPTGWMLCVANELMYLAVLYLLHQRMMVSIAIGAACCVFVTLAASMFCPFYYGKFLRASGFGGGIKVVVHSEDGGDAKSFSGKLLLRTTSWLVLQDEGSAWFEVPVDRVTRIEYIRTAP